MIRRSGSPGGDLVGVQAGGLLEKPAQRRVVGVLLGVRLGGPAQRAEVLEDPFGVLALVGVHRRVSPLLVVADEPAIEHHGPEDDMTDRSSITHVATDAVESFAEAPEPVADGTPAGWSRSRSRARWPRSGHLDVPRVRGG